MIRYLASGYRNFATYPDPPSRRLNWEFFAISQGRCCPVFEGKRGKSQFEENTLWILKPKQTYHWSCEQKSVSRTVFHFSTIPDVIIKQIGDKPYLKIRLTTEQCDTIRHLAETLKPYYINPTEILQLYSTRTLIDLSLFFVSEVKTAPKIRLDSIDLDRIYRAEAYYSEHLVKRPSIDQVAAEVGISSSQLRRHFQKRYKCTPNEAFKRIRLATATRLLSDTDKTIDQVCRESGFASGVDFHRAFKQKYGTTPHKWRNNVLTDPELRGPLPGYGEQGHGVLE